jgi:histidinol-phosphate aminotransferase
LSGPDALGDRTRAGGARPALRLDLNESPHGAGPAFARRLLELLVEREWNRYPDMDARMARESAAELYGWEVAGTSVGNGSNDLLAATVRALLPRGGRLATLAPSFSMYPALAARAGAEHLKLELEPPHFTADPVRLVELARRADLVVLSSPNNPTGGMIDEALMAEVVATGRPVIWDGAYVEFAGVDPVPLLHGCDNLIVLRSLSKSWGLAGLRVGALLASPALASRIGEELLPFGTGWVVAAAYRAASERRADGAKLVADVVGERERQLAALARLPGVSTVPSAANFYLVRVDGLAGDLLVDELTGHGIAVCGVPELAAAGYARVTVGATAEGDAVIAAVRATAARLAKGRR